MKTLQSTPKLAGLSRTISSAETLRRVRPLARELGVTRLADLTGLDRLGIPTYSAIVPDSLDPISVYTGKGAHRIDAQAGALMEAIERQSAIKARPPTFQATVTDIQRFGSTLHPHLLTTALEENYSDHNLYDWVNGFDLLTNCETSVPALCAGFCWTHLPHPSPTQLTTTHGLASGNCLEEAISQSLCEWIERDAWTIAEVLSHWRPRALLESLTGHDPVLNFEDDQERFPCISLAGIGEPVDSLLQRFEAAQLELIVRDITSNLGIPVILACVIDDDIVGYPQVHLGIGAHPDLRVAAARALTEAAQSRCVDIQATREDIELAASVNVTGHNRRVATIDRRRWTLNPSASARDWRTIPNHRHTDILDDIQLILGRLRQCGIQQAIVVDLSPPDSDAVVVRALVPGLETWIVDQGRLGDRAARQWRAASHA